MKTIIILTITSCLLFYTNLLQAQYKTSLKEDIGRFTNVIVQDNLDPVEPTPPDTTDYNAKAEKIMKKHNITKKEFEDALFAQLDRMLANDVFPDMLYVVHKIGDEYALNELKKRFNSLPVDYPYMYNFFEAIIFLENDPIAFITDFKKNTRLYKDEYDPSLVNFVCKKIKMLKDDKQKHDVIKRLVRMIVVGRLKISCYAINGLDIFFVEMDSIYAKSQDRKIMLEYGVEYLKKEPRNERSEMSAKYIETELKKFENDAKTKGK